jgi:hypothetical protein
MALPKIPYAIRVTHCRCNIKEKGESGENLPAGRREEILKSLFAFPYFPFSHFSIFPLLHKGLNLKK